MASVTAAPITFTTTGGTVTVVTTPAVGDLIVVIAAATGLTATNFSMSDNNADGFGATYSNPRNTSKNTSTDGLGVFVRTHLIGSATSTTFSIAQPASTGGGLCVIRITGIFKAGLSAIRQTQAQANQAAAGTPAPVFTNPVTFGDLVLGAVFNASNPAGVTQPTGFTQQQNVGYITPTAGLEVCSINSGVTSSTITWGSTSATAFCSVVVEIDATPNLPLGVFYQDAVKRASVW